MKKFLLFSYILVAVIACKTDLTDIETNIKAVEDRVTDVEKQSQTLQKKNQELTAKSQEISNAIAALQAKSQKLIEQGDSLQLSGEQLAAALDSLRSESQALSESLLLLQKEGEALNDSLDSLQIINEALVIEWDFLQEKIAQTQHTLDSLEFVLQIVEPKLLHVEFLASDNPLQLVENVNCEILGDSAIECRVTNIVSSKVLIPRFRFQGDYVTIDGKVAESGVTSFDFSSTLVLKVYSGAQSKKYTFFVSSYTGLPTLWVETNGRMYITMANEYYTTTTRLSSLNEPGGIGGLNETVNQIKADGTVRWHEEYLDFTSITMMGKNDYTMLFKTAVSLLGEASSKTWKLESNIRDITMLHNQTAFYMGKMSKLGFTPNFHYIDLMMNGIYAGTYMLGDCLDVSSSRVNVGSSGFILSIGSSESGSKFTTQYIDQPITIIAPTSPTSDVVNYIYSYMIKAESVLFSNDFTDATNGWQKYLDIDSFVDWYLINEIAKNTNGAFWSNCIMNLKRGNKLKMGPLWDFSKAFGNASNVISADGFVIKDVSWFARLFRDPVFVSRVKERFNYFYDHQSDIIAAINQNALYLKYAIQEDDSKWDTFKNYKTSNTDTWVLYQASVNSMKTWLANRMAWLKGEFDAMP